MCPKITAHTNKKMQVVKQALTSCGFIFIIVNAVANDLQLGLVDRYVLGGYL